MFNINEDISCQIMDKVIEMYQVFFIEWYPIVYHTNEYIIWKKK